MPAAFGNIKFGDTLWLQVTFLPSGNQNQFNTDIPPVFSVFDNNLSNPIISQSGMSRLNSPYGADSPIYLMQIPITSVYGFNPGHFYNVFCSGQIRNQRQYQNPFSFKVENNGFDSLSNVYATGVALVNSNVLQIGSSGIQQVNLNSNLVGAISGAASPFWSLTLNELSSLPPWSASSGITVGQMLTFIFECSRNLITQTSGLQTIYKNDGVTRLCSGLTTDDGTILTRNLFI